MCTRVGVTRGAFHHHYAEPARASSPTPSDGSTPRWADATSPAPTDLAGLIDATWAAIGNPRFKAVLEAWLAMANDPSLRAEIGPVVAEFAGLVKPDAIAADPHRRRTPRLLLTARETMLGLALGRATNGGKPLGHERRVLARIRAEAATLGP